MLSARVEVSRQGGPRSQEGSRGTVQAEETAGGGKEKWDIKPQKSLLQLEPWEQWVSENRRAKNQGDPWAPADRVLTLHDGELTTSQKASFTLRLLRPQKAPLTGPRCQPPH